MSLPEYAVLQKPRNGKRTYAVTPRIPGGFISSEKLIHLAEVAKKYNGTLKLTSGQRVAILGIEGDDVKKVWDELEMQPAVLLIILLKILKYVQLHFVKDKELQF